MSFIVKYKKNISESMSNPITFLCHNVAAEYIFEQGELTQVRAPQIASEYLR